MRDVIRQLSIGACVVAAVAVAGCQSAPPANPAGVTTAIDANPTSTGTTRQDPGPTTTVAPKADSSKQWAMPNLVGVNLQRAQDQIQALTGDPLFFTSSHDATKRNRNQVLDANWQVCSQNIAPGASFTNASRIDFGAVKLDENCP